MRLAVFHALSPAFLLTLALTAGLSAPRGLQAQSTGDLAVAATIEGFLTVVHQADLAFGTLFPGDGVTVTPGAPPGAGQTLGRVRLRHNTPVAVAATLPPTLSQVGGSGELPVSFLCGVTSTPNGALLAPPVTCGSVPTLSANPNGVTQSYLHVGGVILGSDSSVAAGTYTGTLVLTFTEIF